MADEITLSASLRFKKGDIDRALSKSGLHLDVSGDDCVLNSQLVGTTEEPLLLGDTVPGYLLIFNTDEDNYIEIRPVAGAAVLVKVSPGKVALFELTSNASQPYVVANTAAVRIEYLAIDS